MDAGTLIGELKRRRVFRVLFGYALVSFAILQVVEPIMHGLGLPEVVLKVVVVLLGLGFPVAVVLAWAFDVDAGKVRRAPPPEGHLRGARLSLILVGLGLLAAAPGLAWYFLRPAGPVPAASGAPSIAVLPFANLSGAKENDYLSDGITEEIINALANVEGLRVVARTSVFSFKGKNLDVRKIGEELQVNTLVEGSVRSDGNRVRVTAQLIQAADGYHRWSKTYDRELKSIFSVEDELARAVVQEVTPRLLPGLKLAVGSEPNPEAHDLYLRGRYFWNQRNPEGLAKAQALFAKAIDIDPRYALAWSGLSDVYSLSIDYGDGRASEVLPKALAAAQKSIELDPGLAEAHASLAARLTRDYEWERAEPEFRRAIELRPGYATAHQWFALDLMVRGRTAEAIAEAERARQLDPASAIMSSLAGAIYYNTGDLSHALDYAQRAIELDPASPNARGLLVRLLLASNRLAEARAALVAADRVGAGPYSLPALWAALLVQEGDFAGARKLLSDAEAHLAERHIPAGALARVHLMLGERDACFALLERGVRDRDQSVRGLVANPEWEPIRSDPRYHALLRSMRLE